MSPLFLKIIAPIAAIFASRMLGLFMLIPVFTIYATHLQGATPAFIGIALGIYGLSQGLLQIPFGLLSDQYGRKTMITIGLILFAMGSLLGALTHSIGGMIAARVIQGMGAIGSVLIALLADLTSEKQRTLAMAFIGATIGLSFGIAFMLSPYLAATFGLSGIFYFTACLALFALLLLHTIIPTPETIPTTPLQRSIGSRLKSIILDRNLSRLNAGIFCQHLILTSTFYVIPIRIQSFITAEKLSAAWQFYLPIMLLSFLVMIPMIYLAERRKHGKMLFIIAIGITCMSQFGLICYTHLWPIFTMIMFFYFIAFNILEAMLPSLISKQINPGNKGTAMGVYSSSQFLGIFVGGCIAGFLYEFYGSTAIFIVNTLIASFWFVISFGWLESPS